MFKNKYKFIVYSGLFAFLCLLLTFVWGIGGFDYRVHGILAIVTLVAACLHVGGVILVKRKRR